jgi:hypothetical protein
VRRQRRIEGPAARRTAALHEQGGQQQRESKRQIQKLQLFMRGSAMSGAPIIIGISQLARPTKAGMTAPKTITSACMVVIWLKKCGIDQLQTRLEQLGADDHRHGAADEEHGDSENNRYRCRCPCGWW